MDGKFLDSSAVRSLEKMPTKLQLLTSVAIAIKKVSAWALIVTLSCQKCLQLLPTSGTAAVAGCSAPLSSKLPHIKQVIRLIVICNVIDLWENWTSAKMEFDQISVPTLHLAPNALHGCTAAPWHPINSTHIQQVQIFEY